MNRHSRILYAICAAYVVLATLYSLVTPLFEASDELWHYPMVNYMADTGLQLPVLDPANVGPWRQEGGQPPLYYMLAAVLTSWIDTSDMDFIRRINPHADIGVVRPDGNANMIVHRAEESRWQGTVLAVRIVRFLSIALGLGTVIVTYALAREIFPQWEVVALGAATLVAFLPMFLFISGSVNNDNLSNLLGNLLTLLIVRLLKKTTSPHPRDYVILGVVTGAGLLSKLNIGFLIPLLALALLIVSLRLRDWHPLVIGGVLSGGLTVASAGWWYLRNWQLYGDPTGLNAFLSVVGRRLIPANLAQLWAERHSFTQAYWGFFGGMNVPLPEGVYLAFNIVGGLALASAIVYLVIRALTPVPSPSGRGEEASALALLRWRRGRLEWGRMSPERRGEGFWLPAFVTILWPLVTFISYLRWTAETPASQGRLIFGALSSISLWMAVGLVWWLPRRIQPIIMTVVVGFFAATAVSAPFFAIAPAYKPPMPIPSRTSQAVFRQPNSADNRIGLLDAHVLSERVQPEDYALLEIDWQIESSPARDWSLFIHLTTLEGVIISQRDIYPGQGRLATSDLPQNFAWNNPIAVRVPTAAYAPMTLDVNVGWYHLPTGERMKLEDGSETYTIGQVELLPRASDSGLPNPMNINFDNQLELVGYELSDLTPAAGDDLMLTLYWRGTQPIREDYTVFAHVIDPASYTIYAGNDSPPVEGNAPTSTWMPGVIIEDTRILRVNPNTPPGIYEFEIGLYLNQPENGFPRLRIVTADGGMADNYLYLSRVRVLPAKSE